MMESWIKRRLLEIGFDDVGIVSLENFPPEEEKEVFLRWLELGYHADMDYMEKSKDARLNPNLLLEGAKSAVVVLLSYGSKRVGKLKFARYSTRKDYHKFFKKTLGKFVRECKERFGGEYRVFSDSLPVLERSLGRLAGLGWIGKNSMLISPKFGSYFLIGGFLTNLDLKPDKPFVYDFCGKCNRCIISCPTGAILEGRIIDSRKCISYWTIEYKGDSIPVDTKGWIFGCDICQEVCPWNRKAHEESTLLPTLKIFEEIDLKDILNMDEEKFKESFSGTPIMRAKLKGLKRNALKIAGAGFEPATSGL